MISLFSCTNGPIMHCYQPVNANGWSAKDTIRFEVPIQREELTTSLSIGVRTTDNYPYTALHLKALICKNGKLQKEKVVRIDIYDNSGKNKGKGFLYYEHASSFPLPLEFNADSAYTISIVHSMKEHAINGVSNVGVLIE